VASSEVDCVASLDDVDAIDDAPERRNGGGGAVWVAESGTSRAWFELGGDG